MLLSFLRSLRRKLVICGLLVLVVVLFKKAYPEFGRTVGLWISGLNNLRVVQTFSAILGQLRGGNGLSSAVEVFCDGIWGG